MPETPRPAWLGMIPAHASFSQLGTWADCQYKYVIEKAFRPDDMPAWWFIGGTAFHKATEQWDFAVAGGDQPPSLEQLVHHWIDDGIAEAEQVEPDRAIWRVGGRASKAYPDKENEAFWRDHAKPWAELYEQWQHDTPGWRIPDVDGQPAIELASTVELGGVQVKFAIDRLVVTPEGFLGCRDLKGLAVDTPIPTPSGWTTMGRIAVGDELFGSDGMIVRVNRKSEVKELPCYRVVFNDGSAVVCDNEHLWNVEHGRAGRSVTSVLAIGQIAEGIAANRTGNVYRVPIAGPLRLPAVELPIDPYVLGAWLGDGKHTSAEICKPDDELFDFIAARGYKVGRRHKAAEGRVGARIPFGLHRQLKEAGLIGHKHVPDIYLRASIEQRLDLLRGLMDTDGTWNKARNEVSFTSTNKGLALAVEELVNSLGDRAYMYEYQTRGFSVTTTAYDVKWRPLRLNPFALSRKASRVLLCEGRSRANRRVRIIKSVTPIGSVPTQCIGVTADNNLFLCGRAMIPTHNTGSSESNPEQLGLYKVLAELAFGLSPTFGDFWNPRKGGALPPISLERYTHAYFERRFAAFKAQRESGVLVPNVGWGCARCSVRKYCPTQGGPDAIPFDQD